MLIVFDDLIVDSLNNKDLISVVTELLIKGKKLNTSISKYLYAIWFSCNKKILD